DVAPDALGRILLPKSLKDFAQIKEQVVFVGVSSRIEIWAKQRWTEFYESSRQGFEDVAEKVMLD
ncbi:MAG: division/cell wall cluster transcriptional repressor MraZ, partial [Dehalococcoidia bacterium]|nr:division/cell wall cluster transcriptional repressor MraZ [Dehalococcoidia bacterium]